MAAKQTSQATGYTVDLVYPSSFVLGQAPLQMQWAAVAAGAARGPLTGPFRYCDLGCGDGSTLCLLAACYPESSFVGIDINEAHIALGQGRAARAGLGNVSFIGASFADLESLPLPPFDYIAAYGIYTWLAPALRQAIHAFARQRLKPGGLLGLHYSSLPGAAGHDALGHYLQAFGFAAGGGSGERFAAGLAALRRLVPVAQFFAGNPQASELLQSVEKYPPGSVAHDVLNRESHSSYSGEIHAALAAEGLEFLASANVLPDYPELLLSRQGFAAYRELTAGADAAFRESVRDLMLNAALRFDLFCKAGALPVVRGERLRALADLYLQRADTRSDIETRRRWSETFAVELTASIYSIVLDLAATPGITLGDLLHSRELKAIAAADVERAIEHLFALGLLNALARRPIQTEYQSDRRYRLSLALNAIRLDETSRSTAAEGLASTVLGSPLLIPAGARLRLMALLGKDIAPFWEASGGTATGTLEQFREQVRATLPRFVREGVPQLLRLGVIEEDR